MDPQPLLGEELKYTFELQRGMNLSVSVNELIIKDSDESTTQLLPLAD